MQTITIKDAIFLADKYKLKNLTELMRITGLNSSKLYYNLSVSGVQEVSDSIKEIRKEYLNECKQEYNEKYKK